MTDQRTIIFPAPLRPRDKVAILSPASVVKDEYVDGAAGFLRKFGYEPVVMPSAKGPAAGSYASAAESRGADLLAALTDASIRGVLCARGGYGAVHLLSRIPESVIKADPKWLIGFSDISALHAMMLRAGVASIHGPMAKHLTEEEEGEESAESLLAILEEGLPAGYSVAIDPRNSQGEASGRLQGGNLAVLNGLAQTPFDLLTPSEGDDVILFVEDISEAIYAVERIFWRLRMSGSLERIKGLIVGQFTEYRPDRNFDSMEDMLSQRLTEWGVKDRIPVAFNFPVGHVRRNLPLVEGACARLSVGEESVDLMMTQTPILL